MYRCIMILICDNGVTISLVVSLCVHAYHNEPVVLLYHSMLVVSVYHWCRNASVVSQCISGITVHQWCHLALYTRLH